MRALLLGRRGLGTELSEEYFADSLFYMKDAEQKEKSPSLFDLLETDNTSAYSANESEVPCNNPA